MKEIKPNLIDRAISYFSPKAGAKRMQFKIAGRLMQDQLRKYDAASVGRRTSGWYAPSTGANSEILHSVTYLRNRSREMVRNNEYAEKAINELANNIIGTGILPKPVGLKEGPAKKLMAQWKAWAESTDADYDGDLTLYGLQHLAARCVFESGEVIIRKHIAPGLAFPLQLQVLEPDFIDTTKLTLQTADGGCILYGIEFNSKGKKIAYWLWDQHPGDNMQFLSKSNRIPAEEIIHVFKKDRPGQFRGVPFGHAAMLRLRDLGDFEDAQLIRQKIAACFAVFVTDNEQSGAINSPKTSTPPLEKVEPGIVEYLPAGKQVSMANPPDSGPNYEPYVKSNLRAIAAGYGMDYVTLTGDLTAVNFSSGRMGWLQFHRNITVQQWNTFIPHICGKTWNWFIQLANVTGVIKQISVSVTWTPPRREMIDPVKEVEGIEKAIRAGITSLPAAIRENGDDPDEILSENIDMAAKLDKSGLMYTTDPRFDATRKADKPEEGTNVNGNTNAKKEDIQED